MTQGPMVGVIGERTAPAKATKAAFAVGLEIARRGGILVCGGRGGIMEAAASGAKSGGGMTIGILPGDSTQEANDFIDVPIVTGLGEARNIIVVRTSQVLIAVTGSYGTLSEIAFGLKLGIPVIGLDTWRLERPDLTNDPIIRASDPADAVEKAWKLIDERERDVS